MRFMILMHPGKFAEAPDFAGPTPDTVAEMMKFNEDLAKAGVLLGLDGLHPTRTGARVTRGPGGKKNVIDGPFAESKELVGGYWMIQVRSREEAIQWAKRIPLHHEDTFVEVRQVFDMADFSPEVQKLVAPLEKQLAAK